MNLSREVIDHERIQTTEAKAKAVKPELERLITLAKRGDTHARRQAMARLGQDKFIVYKLFEEIAPALRGAARGLHPDPQAGSAQVGRDRDGLPRAGVGAGAGRRLDVWRRGGSGVALRQAARGRICCAAVAFVTGRTRGRGAARTIGDFVSAMHVKSPNALGTEVQALAFPPMDVEKIKAAGSRRLGEGRLLLALREAAARRRGAGDACAVSAGQEVLDVAAGDGNFALACAAEGASVVASDLAPGMVERGAARDPRPRASTSNGWRPTPRSCRSRTAASTAWARCSGR